MHKIVWKEFYFREFLILLGLNGIKIKHYFSKEKVVILIFSFLITNRQFLWQLFFHFSLYRGCLLPLLLVYLHSIVVLCSSIGTQGYCNLKFFFVFGKKRLFSIYFFFLRWYTSIIVCSYDGKETNIFPSLLLLFYKGIDREEMGWPWRPFYFWCLLGQLFVYMVHSNLDITDPFCSLYQIIHYIKCNML